MARAIAREVKATLSPEEAASLAKRGTVNPEAYDDYLRGGEYSSRGGAERDLRIAIQMFEKAIELDPSFAQAYAALSVIHSAMWWVSYDRTEQRVSLALLRGLACKKSVFKIPINPDPESPHSS